MDYINRTITVQSTMESPGNAIIKARLTDNFHEMTIKLVVNELNLKITKICTMMTRVANDRCLGAGDNLNPLVGLCLGKGFSRQVLARIGGNKGCTHLTNLVLQINASSMLLKPVWDEESRFAKFMDVCVGYSNKE